MFFWIKVVNHLNVYILVEILVKNFKLLYSYKILKLIICYISSGATNIAEVSSGFHQADWSIGPYIGHCLLLSNQLFVLLY